MVFFNEDKFNGHKQACRQIMTQYGDGKAFIRMPTFLIQAP
jgi:hypothetical protein